MISRLPKSKKANDTASTQELSRLRDELESLEKRQSEFVSFAAHQLRAPLTALRGYASLLLEGDLGALPPAAASAAEKIYESAGRLTEIVDGYLDINHLDTGVMKYDFAPVDLRLLVEEIIAELQPIIDRSPVIFSFRIIDPAATYQVLADRSRLRQAITNLLDNAFKYTPAGSVEVILNLDEPRSRVVLEIADTGIGIEPEVMPKLFQKFSRADNAKFFHRQGSGLGLFVAREIIAAHQGELQAQSAGAGRGAKFSISLEPFGR